MDFKHRITRRSSQIRDDRGLLQTMRLPDGPNLASSRSDPGQAVWREYRRVATNMSNPLYHLVISGTCISLALGAAGHAYTNPADRLLYSVVAAGLTIAGLSNPIWTRWRRDRMARELGWVRECLACTYAIDDLPPDVDGCVVCPECGAAWRMGSMINEPDQSLGATP